MNASPGTILLLIVMALVGKLITLVLRGLQ